MSQANDPTEPRCPQCGAVRLPDRASCWLCHADLKSLQTPAGIATRRGATPRGLSYSISTLLLATTLLAICAALVAEAPGLGISMCIVLAPVLVRTVMVVRRREAAGKHVSAGQRIGLILTSFVVTNVILAVVGFAAIATFCAVCVGTVGALNNGSFFVAGISALGVTVSLVVVMARWVRSRYRRDISQD